MGKPSKVMSLGVDLLILCVLITIGIYVSRVYKKTSQVAIQNMNGTTAEYVDAAVSEMLGVTYTGAEVKNYIKKYRRTMQVAVHTLRNPAGMIYDASTVYDVTNNDNVNFVANDDVFVCSADKDTNGNYRSLEFRQAGSLPEGGSVSGPEEAQAVLAGKLGLSSGASWSDIVNAVAAQDTAAAKQTLINSLGGSFNLGSSWSSIASEAAQRLMKYQNLLNAGSSASQHNASGSIYLSFQESRNLDFTPTAIIVRFNSDSDNVYLWMHGAWLGDRPELDISSSGTGVKLTHSDEARQSDSMTVEAFN